MRLPANGDWWALRQLIHRGHLLLPQRWQLRQLYVAGDARGSGALGEDGEVVRGVQCPEQDKTGGVQGQGGGEGLDGRVLDQGLVELGKWGISLNYNSIFSAALYSVMLNIHGMNLELIYYWLYFCNLK